jgi:hypothetical protein
MDLSRKNLHKGQPNLFADIIERRKDEGDVHGLWRSTKSTDAASQWRRRGLLLFTLIIGTAMVFSLVIMPKKAKRQPASDLPGERVAGAPPPAVPGKPPPTRRPLDTEAVPGAKPVDTTAGSPAPPEKTAAKPERPAPAPGEPAAEGEIVRPDGAFVFRPVLPEFKPLPNLDLRFVDDHTWDDIKWPDEATEIKKEAEVIDHIYRFIRTHGADLRLRADPNLTHGEMLKEPAIHRGKVVSTRVIVVKKYMNFGWPKNDSGVQDTTMLFCHPIHESFGRTIFVVLVPQPSGNFKEEELYDLTGVFWKRYAYVNAENKWQWQPLILTMEMTPAPPPAAMSRKVTVWIIVVAAVLIIGLLFLVRGETREGEAKRAARIERRRRQQQQPPSARSDGLAPLQPAGDPHEPPADSPPPPPPAAEDRKADDPYSQKPPGGA